MFNSFFLGWFECTDHLINLCMNDTIRKLDQIKNIVGVVQQIVSFVRDSHLAKETLNKYQRSFGKKLENICLNYLDFFSGFNERQLIYDVTTRWNSTFYMLQRFVEEKMSISACLNEKSFQKNLAKAKLGKNIDWDMQEQLMVGS
jgi:hypothetical protein